MDELLADLDGFLRFHGLPPRRRENCDDDGMLHDMVTALADDETLKADDWSTSFRLRDCAIIAVLAWDRPSGTLAQLDEDVSAFFDRFREADGIIERRCWKDRHTVAFNIFTGTPGSHYHCIQLRVTGPEIEQALAAGDEPSPGSREQAKDEPSRYLLRQRWKNAAD